MNDEVIITKIMEKIEDTEKIATNDAFQAFTKVRKDDIVGAIIQIIDKVIKDENQEN